MTSPKEYEMTVLSETDKATLADDLAKAVTARIFEMGAEYGSPCHRIEFKVTRNYAEVGAGGLARGPFEKYVREAIAAAIDAARAK